MKMPAACRAALVAVCVPATAMGLPRDLQGQEVKQIRRVVMISCDGLRPDAIEAAHAEVMLDLIATGSYQSSCLAELPPVTLPNHISMVTGLRVEAHGVHANTDIPGRIAVRTVLDVAKEAGRSVGFFISKSKLGYLCEERDVDVWRLEADVQILAEEVVAAIGSEDLQLIFVHFREPDSTGHRDGWMSEPYLEAVLRVDAAIGRILEGLNDLDLRDETVVLVTADHGGHLWAHYLDMQEDRFIPFILNGPGIATGRTLCEQVRTMDSAATVLDLLGLPTDSAADGNAVTEARANYAQPDCIPSEMTFGLPCGPFPILFVSVMPVFGFIAWRARRS